jgi:drug/metabolite transporter (DMT)-like permease
MLVIAAAVLWSSSGFFVKAGFFDDWPRDERGAVIAFWRALFAGLALVPLVRRPAWSRQLPWLGLCFAAMNGTYLTAMTWGTAANAIWLQGTAPVWVFLISIFVARRPVRREELAPVLCGLAGVGLILSCEAATSGTGSRGAAAAGLGLLSGVLYACVVALMRSAREQDSAWLVVWNHLAAALLLMPWGLFSGVFPSAWQLVVLAAFGAIQMGVPYWLFARGLKSVGGSEAALLVLLEPMLVPVWAWMATRGEETPRWWTVAGAGLILAGLVLRYRPRTAEERTSGAGQ